MIIVKPETVVGWQRQGFSFFWTKISQRKSLGRPPVSSDVRALIKQMAQANVDVGRTQDPRRIAGGSASESQKEPSERLMPKRRGAALPDMAHRSSIITAKRWSQSTSSPFRPRLFASCSCSLSERTSGRRVLHFNITAHPTAEWSAGADSWKPFLTIRHRAFSSEIETRSRVRISASGSMPWVLRRCSRRRTVHGRNAYVERLIGSIRRECLDHCIVLGERHLRRILHSYFEYYHRWRTHLSLAKDAPLPRPTQPPEMGEVIEIPQVGGLHHRYERRAA